MTAIPAPFLQTHPPDMADDNMEISSELGQNVGGDDIDIDIDFVPDEPGHHDEDHILEDARSDIDYEETNDDLMVDDDNASVPMDDIDLASEGEVHKDLDNPENPAEMADAVSIGAEVRDILEVDVTDDQLRVGDTAGMTWDETQEVDALVEEIVEQNHEELPGADLLATEVQEAQEAQESVQQDPVIEATAETGESVTNNKTIDGDAATTQNVEITRGHESEHDELKAMEGATSRSDALSSATKNATVSYQDAEYLLISASESDDPDSFFLKDDALTRAPLHSFLEGLREVIFDELSPDDELCLAVEDLGIEICETSASTFDMTFAQIMTLREDLLRNDGVNSPDILHVSLGVKPNYSIRLRSLVAGVKEGKGLSQLVSWEEESEDFGEEGTEHEVDHDGDFEDEVGPNDTSKGLDNEVALEQHSPNAVTEAQGDETHEVSNVAGPIDAGKSTQVEKDENADASDTKEAGHTPDQHEDRDYGTEQVTQDVDDETDLIDYGDEPVRKLAPATEEGQQTAEYESINEELRRRSLSQTSERADANTTPLIHLDASHGTSEITASAADELVAEDQKSQTDDDHSHNDDKSDGGSEGGENVNEDTIVALENVPDISRDSVASDQPLLQDEQSAIAQQQSDLQEDFDEIDYADVDNAEPEFGDHEQSDAQDAEDAGISGLNTLESNEEEISFEDIEQMPDSNGSESTLVGDETKLEPTSIDIPDVNNADDEIDYDDDDRAGSAEALDATSLERASPVSTGTNGKRTHADLIEDLDGESRDSKRVCA